MNSRSPIRFLYPVRLRHKATDKYLYSIDVRYQFPGTSGQQMVGASENPDDKFEWTFKHSNSAPEIPQPSHIFVTGDVVRLEHIETRKNLHTHDLESPLSGQKEVTVFGGLGVGDGNDDWEMIILSLLGDGSSAEIVLKHVQTKHFLHSHKILLPTPPVADSNEVTSYSEQNDPNNVWIVERIDKPPIQLSKISTRIEIPERFISFSIESSTSMDTWINAADHWIKQEEEKWAWLTNLESPLSGLGVSLDSPKDLYRNAFRQLSAAVREIANNQDSKNFETSLITLENTFKHVYAKHQGILFSGEPSGVFACGYSATNPVESTVAVAVLTGRDPVVVSASAVKGVNAAVLFLEGKHGQFVQAHKEALDGLRQSWEVSAKATLAGLQSKTEAAEERIRTLNAKALAFDAQTEKLVADETASIAALKDTLRQQVMLKDSIKYWEDRATATNWKAFWFGLATVVCVGASIVAIIWECSHYFGAGSESGVPTPQKMASPIPILTPATQTVVGQNVSAVQVPNTSDVTTKPHQEEDRSKQYWRYLVIAVTLTFAVWICRVLMRITMSNLHTSSDAGERVTMLQTFLSLMSDKSIDRKEDLKLILQTVFRPGTTGLIQDESGMQTPLEMVLKTVSGRDKSPDK